MLFEIHVSSAVSFSLLGIFRGQGQIFHEIEFVQMEIESKKPCSGTSLIQTRYGISVREIKGLL